MLHFFQGVGDDCLTVQQVTSAFSRMSAKFRKGELKKLIEKKKRKENEDEENEDDEKEFEQIETDEREDIDDEVNRALRNLEIDVVVGKYVHVSSHLRASHYAGQVTEVNVTEVGISFLSPLNSKNTFMWPSPLQNSKIDINCIHLELDVPIMDRRDHLVFTNVDICEVTMFYSSSL